MDHEEKENITTETQEFYSNFTIDESMYPDVRLFTFSNGIILVIGVSMNCVALLACNAIFPRYSSFVIYLKIILYMNITVMAVLFAHHESYLLDFGIRHDLDLRQRVCVTTNWFYYLADHCLASSIFLLSLNRIRAQRQRDYYSTLEEAMRWPIVANSLLWLIVSVPVSRYTVDRFHFVERFNRTECSFGIAKPFNHAVVTDQILADLPLLQDAVLVASLFALVIEIILKKRRETRRKEAVMKRNTDDSTYDSFITSDDSESESSCIFDNPLTIIEPKQSHDRSERSTSVVKFLRTHNIDTMSIDESGAEVRGYEFGHALDRLTAALILLFVIFRLPRDILMSMHAWPFDNTAAFVSLKESHIGIMSFEAIPQIVMCSPLLLFFILGSDFRQYSSSVLRKFIRGTNLNVQSTRVGNAVFKRPVTVIQSTSWVQHSASRGSVGLILKTKHSASGAYRKKNRFADKEGKSGPPDYIEDFKCAIEIQLVIEDVESIGLQGKQEEDNQDSSLLIVESAQISQRSQRSKK